MTGFSFRPAVRENVGLLIGLAGGTGSGKTYTAMRLAAGIAGAKPFCVIDTEAGRAKHYADQFTFDHGDLQPPFRPDAYAEAIIAADKAGYPVIVVDSVSHVWAGDGGVLDWQEAELDRMAGQDYKKREACKMAAWIKPKTSHKHMVQKLLQVRAHLILCFRAEEKIEMVRKDGKLEVQPKQTLTGLDGWVPICEKNLPFELTASFLLLAKKPGIPHPIKLQEQHRELFPDGKPITEESGRKLAAWASGAAAPKAAAPAPAQTGKSAPPPAAQAATGEASAPPSEPANAPAGAAASNEPTEPAEQQTVRGFAFFHPGVADSQDTAETPEAWWTIWARWCDTIMASKKLDAAAKDKKIRELKKANDGVLKRMGTIWITKINGDVAARAKTLKEAATQQ